MRTGAHDLRKKVVVWGCGSSGAESIPTPSRGVLSAPRRAEVWKPARSRTVRGSRKRTVASQRSERIVLKATCAPIHSVGAHHEMNIPREEPLRISPPRLGPGDQRGPESALLKVTHFCPPHSNFLGMGSEGKRRRGL